MKTTNSVHAGKILEPGDHLCSLYETDQDRRALLAWFLRQGLERGEKVLYLRNTCSEEAVTGCLPDCGFDVKPFLSSGQLGVLSFDETYVGKGVFDPDEMINLLGAEVERACAQGHRALRVTGEMNWALRGLPGSEKLIEYEAKLNKFFPGSKCIGLCQYDRRLFPPALLLDVLATHPLAIIGTELFENFYYVPPEDFFRCDSAVLLDHWLHNLKEYNRAKEEIKAAYQELEQVFNTATDGMCVIDKDFNLLRVNAAFSSLVGMRKDETTGKKCYEVFPSPACHTPRCSLTRILNGEKRVEYESERTRTDGGRVPCITRAVPLRGSGGELVGIIEDFKDITERKMAEEHKRLLPQKLLQAQEKARQRIARDLHDQVAQDLFTVKVSCETLFDDQSAVPAETKARLLDLTRMVQGSIVVVRNLAYDLRPPILDQLGLVPAVFQYCQEFSAKTGVKVDFHSAGLDRLRLDSETEINLYRLVQEGLNNVRKHADAKRVIIKLTASFPKIILRIEDDGKGFDVKDKLAGALREKRLGLQSMQERAGLLSGKMRIQSRIRQGTRISIEVPYQKKTDDAEYIHIDH